MFSKLFIFTLKVLVAVIAAGVFVSLFHQNDFMVMLFLAVVVLAIGIIKIKRKSKNNRIYFLGFGLSAVFGILAENWGIQSGLWKYHDLSNGREFPYWLPFAWGLAFAVLYYFEAYYIKVLQIKTFQSKIAITLLTALTLPTVGEIITVQMGVWTYMGDYKLLGIPLYAIVLLGVFHTGTYLLLYTINLKWKVQDPVFSVLSNTNSSETPNK